MIHGNEELGIEGALKRGYDANALNKLKDEWIKFGSYSFNRAHSSAYALIGYITAWLKAYFPVHFWSSLMSQNKKDGSKGGEQKNAMYTKEAKMRGIRITPPSYLTPSVSFTPIVYDEVVHDQIEDKIYIGEIRVGMGSIPSVTTPVINDLILVNELLIGEFSYLSEIKGKVEVLAENEEKTPNEQMDMFAMIGEESELIKKFTEISEQIQMLAASSKSLNSIKFEQYLAMIGLLKSLRSLTKEKVALGVASLENLVQAGAFDTMTNNRYDLLRQVYVAYNKADKISGLPTTMKKADFVKMEKEMLGYTVTVESRIANMVEGDISSFTGEIKDIQSWTSSANKRHFNMIIECSGEELSFTLWGYLFERLSEKGQVLVPGVKVTARAEKSKFEGLTIKTIKVVE